MTDNFWERPRPPVETAPEPWTELPPDTRYPGLDGGKRMFIERHHHKLYRAANDDWDDIAVTAVFHDDGWTGPQIEFGPWSIEPHDARTLAASLIMLADAAEPTRTGE